MKVDTVSVKTFDLSSLFSYTVKPSCVLESFVKTVSNATPTSLSITSMTIPSATLAVDDSMRNSDFTGPSIVNRPTFTHSDQYKLRLTIKDFAITAEVPIELSETLNCS